MLDPLNLPEKFDWWNVRAAIEEWVFGLVNSGRFVPPGTIALYGASTPPEEWVACDGASYEKTKYPDLYKAIGDAHGATATEFQVPPAPSAAPANTCWMIKV